MVKLEWKRNKKTSKLRQIFSIILLILNITYFVFSFIYYKKLSDAPNCPCPEQQKNFEVVKKLLIWNVLLVGGMLIITIIASVFWILFYKKRKNKFFFNFLYFLICVAISYIYVFVILRYPYMTSNLMVEIGKNPCGCPDHPFRKILGYYSPFYLLYKFIPVLMAGSFMLFVILYPNNFIFSGTK